MTAVEDTFTPNEVEFLAEDQLVTILPSFKADKVTLIEGEFGPFRPATPVEVPLWMAIQLKKFHKCQIKAPDWMDLGSTLLGCRLACFNESVRRCTGGTPES